MLQAIVGDIPEPHSEQIVDLWGELQRRFGVHSELTAEFPHFSLHVANTYAEDELVERLGEFCAEHPPLRVRTAGLGLFTRQRAVLYMPLVRNPRLNAFHRALWKAISGLGEEVRPYYRPERWIPHVTLAHDNLDQYNLGGAISWLADQHLDWVFDVTTLSVLEADGTDRRVVGTFELSGASES